MSRIQRVPLFAAAIFALLLLGCDDRPKGASRHEPSWTCWVWFCDDCKFQKFKDETEAVRSAKLRELRAKLSSSFLIGAIGYVCIGLLGPSMAEGTRKLVADQLKMSVEDQVLLAKWAYGIVVSSIFLFSVFNIHLGTVRPAVWLLLGATTYPFFVHVIPSLESGDKTRRKAAVSQIKAFLMLIFIFYVILRMLSPQGFGDIQLQ